MCFDDAAVAFLFSREDVDRAVRAQIKYRYKFGRLYSYVYVHITPSHFLVPSSEIYALPCTRAAASYHSWLIVPDPEITGTTASDGCELQKEAEGRNTTDVDGTIGTQETVSPEGDVAVGNVKRRSGESDGVAELLYDTPENLCVSAKYSFFVTVIVFLIDR